MTPILKGRFWLDLLTRHKQPADVGGAGAYGTRIRMQLYLECYRACRRYQDCHCGERRLRYVAAFIGQLSDKLLLACTW
jgi:hypothetical protein